MSETVGGVNRGSCPTPTAHKRLAEAHRFWHECLEEYHDPEGFRVKLNACIQALRNVTFALQKEKSLIEDFDAWYARWQQKMRKDQILRWVVNSRNRIVKEGDLHTRSKAIGRIILGYDGAADEVRDSLYEGTKLADGLSVHTEVQASATLSNEEIEELLTALEIPDRFMEQATFTIERRWVDEALPNRELLDALATAFGSLNILVSDAHIRAGMSGDIRVEHGTQSVALPRHSSWRGRYPCMVTSRAERTVAHAMDGGLAVSDRARAWRVKPDPEVLALSRERYDVRPGSDPSTWTSALDAVPEFVENAKAILKADPEHGWMMFYFRGGKMSDAQVLAALDRPGKRKLAQDVADHVAANGFDGTVMVGESWISPMTMAADGAPLFPSDHPEKTEVLSIDAAIASGGRVSICIPFSRHKDRPIEIGEALDISNASAHNFMLPTEAVWTSWA